MKGCIASREEVVKNRSRWVGGLIDINCSHHTINERGSTFTERE
jgi:hypothetical protein